MVKLKELDDIVIQLIKLAEKSDVSFRHSAAVIKDNNIISMGYNKYIFNKELGIYTTVHAEIDALNKVKKYTLVDVVTLRLSNTGTKLSQSRPCSMCIQKMKKRGVRYVYYSDQNGEIIKEEINKMEMTHFSASYKCAYGIKTIT